MINYSNLKKKLLNDPKVLKEYKRLEPEFAIAEIIIAKRIEKGFTQAELAKKMGTKQSAVSRLESGSYNPSLSLLQKVALALDLKLKIVMS